MEGEIDRSAIKRSAFERVSRSPPDFVKELRVSPRPLNCQLKMRQSPPGKVPQSREARWRNELESFIAALPTLGASGVQSFRHCSNDSKTTRLATDPGRNAAIVTSRRVRGVRRTGRTAVKPSRLCTCTLHLSYHTTHVTSHTRAFTAAVKSDQSSTWRLRTTCQCPSRPWTACYPVRRPSRKPCRLRQTHSWSALER